MMKLLAATCLLMAFFISSSGQTRNLDYFLSQGMENSPLLKDYAFQVASNQIDSQRLSAFYLPQVSGNSAAVYAPTYHGWGYDGAITNFQTFNALISVSKQFVTKNNLGNQYAGIQWQNRGLQNQATITKQDLQRTITQQYINAYGDYQQISYNRDLLSLLKDEETILKTLAEKAVYKQTDFLAFLVNLQQQELLVKQLEAQYQNDYASLNYLCGINDTAMTILEEPSPVPVEIPDFGETVFSRKYSIDSFLLQIDQRQVDLNYQPRIAAFADGGYNSSFLSQSYKNFGVSAGISLTVPIYDGHQRKMQHQKLDIAEQNRKTYRDFYSKQYNQQVAQLLQQLQSTEQLIAQASTQIKYAEGLINAYRSQLVTGDVRIADYIIAIGNYLSAKNSTTVNKIARLQIINQLNYWTRKAD